MAGESRTKWGIFRILDLFEGCRVTPYKYLHRVKKSALLCQPVRRRDKKMHGAVNVLQEAVASVSTKSGAMQYARIGFNPLDDGSIHKLDLRHQKRSKKRVTPRCEGKVRFRDRQEAKAALLALRYGSGISSLEEAKANHLPFREYPCFMGCNGFHISSKEDRTNVYRIEVAA